MKQSKIKTFVLTALVSMGVTVAPLAQASGIPVVDAGAIAQAVQQVVHMKTQIDNQIKQISELKSQVAAISGTRNLGQILNTVKDQVPDEWKSLYGSVTATNYKDY
ncbi:type IV secretion system protein [Snodgrassella sp. CFCC 13594]|uniref:type IV secretion system protein n=1 Tax=Snodgrassella sp. CFCC 13594 TaxID=1775559 RepID=UPI00082DE9E7|nr:type IV secretion system protein [Snodgrassella sp. CFCC 13594]